MDVVTRILRVDLSHRARSGGRAGIAGSSLLLVVGVTGRHAVGNGEGAERLSGGVQVPGSLQMNPTGPPELFQPSRDLKNSQKVD